MNDSFNPRRRWLASTAAIILAVMVLRMNDASRSFTQTWDEPAHIAAGMQWLDQGRYAYESLHPPMARVAVALPPWILGRRSTGETDIWKEGNAILEQGHRYTETLAAARMGNLGFVILGGVAVTYWGLALAGPLAGALTCLVYSLLPTLLAHGGLATTDMAAGATLAIALLALGAWVETPSPLRALLLGGSLAMAILTKFTSIPYFFAAALLTTLIWWWREGGIRRIAPLPTLLRSAGTAAVAASVLIWAMYRFTIGPVLHLDDPLHAHAVSRMSELPLGHLGAWVLTQLPLPAPEFLRGVGSVLMVNSEQRMGYLFGQVYQGGRLAFFPVALIAKLPLAVLPLTLVGFKAIVARRARPNDWAAAAAIGSIPAVLAVAMASRLNIGVRHVLPVFLVIAVLAGVGAARLLSGDRLNRVLGFTLVALLGFSSLSRTQTISHTSMSGARREPPVLVDSDLDWWQDLGRLVDTLQARQIDHLWLAYNGSADLSQRGLPHFDSLVANSVRPGWTAVSAFPLYTNPAYSWLRNVLLLPLWASRSTCITSLSPTHCVPAVRSTKVYVLRTYA